MPTSNFDDQTVSLNESLNQAVSPGQLLRAARQTLQLSHTEVADKLRLSVQCVKDLEVDEHSHIGASVYVRGYLLSYARLLGIKYEDMMTALSTVAPRENVEQVVNTQNITEKNSRPFNVAWDHPRERYKRHFSRWFAGIAVVVLVVMVVAWWQSQKKHLYSVSPADITSGITDSKTKSQSTSNASTNSATEQSNQQTQIPMKEAATAENSANPTPGFTDNDSATKPVADAKPQPSSPFAAPITPSTPQATTMDQSQPTQSVQTNASNQAAAGTAAAPIQSVQAAPGQAGQAASQANATAVPPGQPNTAQPPANQGAVQGAANTAQKPSVKKKVRKTYHYRTTTKPKYRKYSPNNTRGLPMPGTT